MIVLRQAWRNLWRNKRRTVITLMAVSLNVAILILTFCLMDGMMEQFIGNATNLVIGEAQVHAPEYLVNRSLYKSIEKPDQLLAEFSSMNIPAAARSYGFGLVARETKSAGALFWGVDPAVEKVAFDLANHVAEGTFLPDQPQKKLVLGKKLARSLGAEIGSEIVVVVQAADGSLGNDLFTVAGIFKSAGEAIDRNAAMLDQADFVELFVSGGRIHEIALNTRGGLLLEEVAAAGKRAAPKAETKTWRELMPSLSDMTNIMDASMALFSIVFFLAAGMGVMNTMLMATFERIREFGILKALGTTPLQIMRDVGVEALAMGMLSTVIGTAIGVAGSYYLQVNGLNTASFAGDYTVAGVAFDPIWRAVITLKSVLFPVVAMWIICLLASIYPAALAARLDPVKAISRI